jgi:hypothetical protein
MNNNININMLRCTRSMMSWITLRSEDTYFLHLVGWM